MFDLTAVDTDPVILEHPMVRPAAALSAPSRSHPSTHVQSHTFALHKLSLSV